MLRNLNLLGAATAVAFYLSAIAVFSLRLAGKQQTGFWIGIFEFCLAVPLIYLLIRAPEFHRPALYYVQIALLLVWLLAELFLDYILKIEFRQIYWMVIAYVTLFFAAGGGMLGVAMNAGKGWGVVSVVLFLIMAALAFIQRRATGW